MMIAKNKTIRNSSGKGFPFQALHNESGVVLIMALLFMVVLISMIPMAMQLTIAEVGRTQNFKEDREAFFVAEAGLEHAKALVEASSPNGVLAGPDNTVSTTSSNSVNDDNGIFSSVGGTVEAAPDNILSNKITFGTSTYYIRARDNDDGDNDPSIDSDSIIILTAMGEVNNITTTVESMIFNPPGAPVNAVTANGILEISGNPKIKGSCGSVHTNGDGNGSTDDLVLSGSADVDVNVTSTGTTDVNHPGNVLGDIVDNADEIPIPNLNPTDYEQYADYTLASNGDVFEKGNPSPIHSNSSDGDEWGDWKFSDPKWEIGSNSAPNGSFYVDGDVSVGGNPGSPGTPWEVTIVATGYIEVSGNPDWENKKDPNLPEDIQNVFLLAGTDIKMNGNNTMTSVEGLIYAREQIDLSGNSKIYGSIMSLDEFTGNSDDPHGLIDKNYISGNSTITYGCGLAVPGVSTNINVVSWHQR